MSHTEYYAEQKEHGEEFQDYVSDLLHETCGMVLGNYCSRRYQLERGENKAGVEIKLDKRWRETGNLYIETAEKSRPENPEYIPSGMDRGDNSWFYAIGDYSKLWLLPLVNLRILRAKNNFKTVETPTSRGFLLPCGIADEYAAKVIIPSPATVESPVNENATY